MTVRLNGDLKRMITRVQGMPARLRDESEQLVAETINEGAELMRYKIEHSGVNGKEGRIDTGWMLGTVTAIEPTVSKDRITGEYGWPTSGYEKYFSYQENGFKGVPPMHALLESFIEVREKFFDKLVKMVRG